MVCPYDWSFPGGVRTHIVGLSDALRGKGLIVDIFAPASGAEPAIHVVGRSFPVRFNGSVARICFSRSARSKMADALASGAYDVIHLHEPAIPSVSLLALGVAKGPMVATFHASATSSRAYSIAGPWLNRKLSRIDIRIAVSRAARDLASTHLPGEYELIPNGVSVQRFAHAKADASLTALKPFILFVGRNEPRKGFQVALSAVERIREKSSVNLVAVGPTPTEVPSWVRALGSVDQETLPSIYAAADVFCAPSVSGESFGIVLAEAMAAGLPVVCSDLPGYVEAAGGAALHAPAGDIPETARLLERVLQEAGTSQDLIERGSVRAQELDWDTLCEKVIDCYERASPGMHKPKES